MKLINIGFGNMVSANRIITIVSPESAPIKRIIQDARDSGSLIDATYGRRTRAVIVMDSGHVVLSAIQPETVANRFGQPEDLQVVFRGGTDDHLGALAGGDELGRMAIADQIGGVFLNPGADLAHRG